MPPPETFIVEEINPRHGFARLRAEAGAGVFHTGLFPELPGGELSPLRLQVGDRLSGLRRGQTVSQVSWLTRAAPPPEAVERMEALVRGLEARGLHVTLSPEALADHHWREGAGSPLLEELRPQLRLFFEWERAHPFEDETLLTRVEEAMREHLPGLSVRPVPGASQFRVEPGAHVIAGGTPERDKPSQLFELLVEHLNQELGRTGAAVRWMPVRDNWVLATPELVLLLVEQGVLQGSAAA